MGVARRDVQVNGRPTESTGHTYRAVELAADLRQDVSQPHLQRRIPTLATGWLIRRGTCIIIDNSRAFTIDIAERVHKLTRIDRDLWNRMVALDEPTLQAAVGEWLGDREIRAILERRDEMAEDIEKLVEKVGEAGRVCPLAGPSTRDSDARACA